MKYFIDIKRSGLEIISIGITSEDDRYYYAISKEFNLEKAWKNEEVQDEVLIPLIEELTGGQLTSGYPFDDLDNLVMKEGLDLARIAMEVKLFMSADSKTQKQLYSYDANIIGTLFSELTQDRELYCRNLRQMLDDKVFGLPFYEHSSEGMMEAWFGWEKPAEALAMVESYENFPILKGGDALAESMFNKELHWFIVELGL